MTLGGIAGPASIWCPVERNWIKALGELRIDEWHTVDAIARTGEFAGWTEKDISRAFAQLFNVLSPFRFSGLTAYVCSVRLNDYDRLKDERKGDLKEPEAICVDFCVGGLQLAEVLHLPFIQLFFDEDENFMNKISRVWQNAKKARRGWAHQIAGITVANSAYTPAIQIADLVAWIFHRCHSTTPTIGNWMHATDLTDTCFIVLETYQRLYDYEALVRKFRIGSGEMQ